jgi:hypothetical protein
MPDCQPGELTYLVALQDFVAPSLMSTPGRLFFSLPSACVHAFQSFNGLGHNPIAASRCLMGWAHYYARPTNVRAAEREYKVTQVQEYFLPLTSS